MMSFQDLKTNVITFALYIGIVKISRFSPFPELKRTGKNGELVRDKKRTQVLEFFSSLVWGPASGYGHYEAHQSRGLANFFLG